MTKDKYANKRIDMNTMCGELHKRLGLVYSGCGHIGGMLEDMVTDEEIESGAIDPQDMIMRLIDVADVLDKINEEIINMGAWVKANEPSVILVH